MRLVRSLRDRHDLVAGGDDLKGREVVIFEIVEGLRRQLQENKEEIEALKREIGGVRWAHDAFMKEFDEEWKNKINFAVSR